MTEQESRREEEVDLLDLLLVLAKRKKLLLGITLGACVISVVVALLLPRIYRAETQILPPQQSGSSVVNQFLGQMGGVSGLVGAATGLKNPNELYIGMLQSRTVLDRIIDHFDLMKLYDAEYREDAREELLDAVEAESDRKSGIIKVSVEDKDPDRAAAMANA
ncbi:MAG: Wzz/FepE/Etk N-terminal domain-containing protein, partial [Candidatus Deferrimicrobiaceae bacterium]